MLHEIESGLVGKGHAELTTTKLKTGEQNVMFSVLFTDELVMHKRV